MTLACRWRSDIWQGIDWSKTQLARLADNPNRANGALIGPWGPSWDEQPQQGKVYHVNRSADMPTNLELMQELRPAYFANGPKMIQALAAIMDRQGIRIELEAVLAYGEGVNQADRDAAQSAFGARIIELYSSKEAGGIAHPCPSGSGLHVNAEAMLVEIVNDDDLPTAEGVVVTPFSTSAMPLIRYDQGDRAVVGKRCSCGRSLPLLESIAGRTTAIFRHPDGRMNVRMLHTDLRKLIGAGQWQIAQVGPTNFEVRYVARHWGVPRDEDGFIENFRNVYFSDASVRLIGFTKYSIDRRWQVYRIRQ
jgi:phenylacetate-CoA ligase